MDKRMYQLIGLSLLAGSFIVGNPQPAQAVQIDFEHQAAATENKAAKEKSESTTPGARWTELKTLNPSDDDVQRIFADNPFAPFAVPLGLGVIFAGGLEKFLVFRRQL